MTLCRSGRLRMTASAPRWRSTIGVLVLGILLACPAGATAALLSAAQIYSGGVYDISCPSTTQCTVTAGALGEPNPVQEVTFDPLSPGPPSPVTIQAGNDLFSLACPSVSQCTAGDIGGQELTFDPSSPGAPTPVTIETGLTYSMACPAENQCTATGYSGVPATTFSPKEPKAATHFTLGTEGEAVFTLACPSVSECAGVSSKGTEVTFDPQSPGVSVPTASLAPGAELHSIACPSVNQCTTLAHGAAMTFDPNPPGTPSTIAVGGWGELRSIACPSSEQCTAGASGGMEVTFNPLAPGSPTPIYIDVGVTNLGQNINHMACPSTSQCTAVDEAGRELTFNPNTQSAPPSPVTPIATQTTVTAAQVSALLARQLRPTGRRANIAALLRSGGYSFGFEALEAGTASFYWYYLPRGATLAGRRVPEPVIVAKAHLACPGAGTIDGRITLTRAGRRLLRHAKRLKLIAKVIFNPVGQAPITATKAIEVRRPDPPRGQARLPRSSHA